MLVKITVHKTLTVEDVFRGDSKGFDDDMCPRHSVGEVFFSENHECPTGFCSWAFADIQKDIVNLHYDAPPYYDKWLKGKRINHVSCTMGQHPVIFTIERIQYD
jgi:uncharacterized repeat protein (TIGR04076 family)